MQNEGFHILQCRIPHSLFVQVDEWCREHEGVRGRATTSELLRLALADFLVRDPAGDGLPEDVPQPKQPDLVALPPAQVAALNTGLEKLA